MRRRTCKTLGASVQKQQSKSTTRQFHTMALTVDEMAEAFRISRPTAYALVKQKGFPAFRIGGRIIVNRKALQEWLDGNRGLNLPKNQGRNLKNTG